MSDPYNPARLTEPNEFGLAVAPSGMKAVFTWHEFCPDEKRDGARCSMAAGAE